MCSLSRTKNKRQKTQSSFDSSTPPVCGSTSTPMNMLSHVVGSQRSLGYQTIQTSYSASQTRYMRNFDGLTVLSSPLGTASISCFITPRHAKYDCRTQNIGLGLSARADDAFAHRVFTSSKTSTFEAVCFGTRARRAGARVPNQLVCSRCVVFDSEEMVRCANVFQVCSRVLFAARRAVH